ncbi:uncharacterized protein LOC114800971 [Denticeps clupeoides]|uniref:uncharacterized protein LOC114800971 n=1 Tax=Denticeps clupeoides TaxID=299321 RepID=UPI0010A46823|nr:uncharacterized protein LOC114800971 [Denticeps clupeoides]
MTTFIIHEMEKLLMLNIMIKLIFSGNAASNQQWNKTTATNMRRTVIAGDEVILHCSEKHHEKTEWFGHRSDQAPFFKVTADRTSDNKDNLLFIWGFKSRITATWNPNNQSFSLIIKNMTVSTEGFYYCTTGEGLYTVIGNVHNLVIAKNTELKPTTPTISTTTSSQMQVMLSSRFLPTCEEMFAGQSVAAYQMAVIVVDHVYKSSRENLSLALNTSSAAKKAQQRLYF